MFTLLRRFAIAALLAAGLPAAVTGAPATVWNLELARGRTGRTSVTVLNRCKAAHVFETGAEDKTLRQVEKALSLKRERSFELKTIGRPVTLFRLTAPERGHSAAVGALQKYPAVRFAQPNFLYNLEQSSSNDPYRDRQYALTLVSPQTVGSCTGTSPAAAQVSGVVALLLLVRPELQPAEVRQLLEETARDLGPPGRDDQFGWGAVDVCRALSKLTGDAEFCR